MKTTKMLAMGRAFSVLAYLAVLLLMWWYADNDPAATDAVFGTVWPFSPAI